MNRKEYLIKIIKFRVRTSGMKEVSHLLRDKILGRIEEMDEEELEKVLELLEKDDLTLRRELLKED